MNFQKKNMAKIFPERPSKLLFKEEFSEATSTILYSNRFLHHARTICVDEQNYLGLFALDTVQKNRHREYRKDDISPSICHQAHLFFQLQNFHESDKKNSDKDPKYLPDKPHLDKALAWLHDEGEDIFGLTKKQLNNNLIIFADNIYKYVQRHNEDYPDLELEIPSEDQISQIYDDIPDLVEPFDIITKKYKNTPNIRTYYDYHADMLGKQGLSDKEALWHARACRVKCVDKAVNASTFSYRSRSVLEGEKYEEAHATHREWVISQVNKMRDIYFLQDFPEINFISQFDSLKEVGFTGTAMNKFTSSAPMISVMRDVMRLQLKLYSNNVANEGLKQGSPIPLIILPEYKSITLSSRVNLLDITLGRLKENARIDTTHEQHPKGIGMFGIPFHSVGSTRAPIPLEALRKNVLRLG